MAENASAVLKYVIETTMRYPRPLSACTNSPTTAPTTDRATATFRPLKRNGTAVGNRIFTNSWSRDAFSERLRSRSSAGTALSPVAVSTTIGKNATRNAIKIFGVWPTPIRITMSGAMATFGTDCVTTSSG